MQELIISEAMFSKFKILALDIHNLAKVYRNYHYGDKSWWNDNIYIDKQRNEYTPDQIFELRGERLRQFMLMIDSCLVEDPPAKTEAPDVTEKIEELDRIMAHGG